MYCYNSFILLFYLCGIALERSLEPKGNGHVVYIRCPKCELNYMLDTEEMCDVCKQKEKHPKGGTSTGGHVGPIIIPPVERVNGQAIFFVFQNKNFGTEFYGGYILAPYQTPTGVVPHHWERLEQVKKGDIIIHCNAGFIRAISIAKDKYYDALSQEEWKSRKVDCEYHLLKNPLYTPYYKDEIIKYCSGKQYQPFNKNGTGNQGYLFDIDRKLAMVFITEAAKKNKDLSQEKFIIDLLNGTLGKDIGY